jgi:hypothetical protein
MTGERSVVDDKELAAIIAREIFEAGADGPNLPATRIQYMHQPAPDAPERPMGGFAEKPLANFIESVLAKHRSY